MIIVSMRSPFINLELADLVTDYLESKGIDRVVPLVGCTADRLMSYYKVPKSPNS